MAKKIRVGVIGVGGYAQGNIRRFLELPDIEITDIVDTNPERFVVTRHTFPQLANAVEHVDYRKMLKESDIDAVYISSPHTLHYQQIMDSMRAGRHVLCDKPMVCKITHAKNVVKKAEETGLVMMIAYQRHYQGPFIYMREQVQSGALGKLQFITAFQSQNWLKSQRGKWRQTMALSGGGQLNDSGSHLLDIIMWIAGEPVTEVSAFSEHFDTEVDINTAVKMQFENGALGTISVVGDGCKFWEEILICGSKGQLIYHQGSLTHITEVAGPTLQLSFPQTTANPVANFVECIRDKKAVNHTPALCGLRTIELTEAAWKSAASNGKVVKVPRSKV